jgi:ribulose-5-phosphate 4-epimerase/fuculose-1-phosphate aldolase
MTTIPSSATRRTELSSTLSERQRLALLLRILSAHGYDDKLAGHISLRPAGVSGELLVNPLGVFWDEVRAADLLLVDRQGLVLEGDGAINPTVLFHHAVHDRRPDIGVLAHNHPPYGTIWAAAGEIPPLLDQTGGNGGGTVVRYADYTGALLSDARAAKLAEAYGGADVAILDNHGVLVSGEDVGVVLVRALSFEWRCRLAFQVQSMGRSGPPVAPEIERELAQSAATYGRVLFAGYGRRLVAADPSVLDE